MNNRLERLTKQAEIEVTLAKERARLAKIIRSCDLLSLSNTKLRAVVRLLEEGI